MKYIKHFITISIHKWLVFKYCCRCGMFFRGLMHDWSKYSFTEMSVAKYYRGNGSPISLERSKKGYSRAYLHHKRNKHHLEYWSDFFAGRLILIRIPYIYQAEMICDMIAAGKVYHKKAWDVSQPKKYLEKHRGRYEAFMHPDSLKMLIEVFNELEKSDLKKILKKKYLKKVYNENLNHPLTVRKIVIDENWMK